MFFACQTVFSHCPLFAHAHVSAWHCWPYDRGQVTCSLCPSFCIVGSQTGPIHGGQGEPKEDAGYSIYSTWVGWMAHIRGLPWGAAGQVYVHTCLPDLRSLNRGFHWVQTTYSPSGLNTTSRSQGCILGAASENEEGRWNAHSNNRGGSATFHLPGSSSWVNQPSCLLHDLSQHTPVEWGCGEVKSHCACQLLSSVPGTL